MPEQPPSDMSGLDLNQFKHWKPEFQQKALALLQEHQNSDYKEFYCGNRNCDGKPHGPLAPGRPAFMHNHARADQYPPPLNSPGWLTLLLSGGRGSGKTRTGAEITHRATEKVGRIILVAPTGPDLRETMVEGVSGILACSPPGKRPLWEPSKKKLTWPNGCIAQGFSAEEPDRLRGPQSGFIWGDEPAHWPLVDDCWSNMQFGLRMGTHPKIIATSTPKPTKWMKKLMVDKLTVIHRVSTYANLDNLAEAFKITVLDRYEGTRLGKQELHGELLEDVEGALWMWDMFQWEQEFPHFTRIVVAVDPAGSANAKSDETGIIVLGIDEDKRIWVLADETGKYSPGQWGDKVMDAAHDWKADFIVAEKNYGGDMVRHVLEVAADRRREVTPRIELVESRRGKALRAEPIVALYEKRRIVHGGKQGDLSALEDEQTSWVPGEGASPNRVDAMVHGATALAERVMPASISDPNKLLRGQRLDQPRHLRAV